MGRIFSILVAFFLVSPPVWAEPISCADYIGVLKELRLIEKKRQNYGRLAAGAGIGMLAFGAITARSHWRQMERYEAITALATTVAGAVVSGLGLQASFAEEKIQAHGHRGDEFLGYELSILDVYQRSPISACRYIMGNASLREGIEARAYAEYYMSSSRSFEERSPGIRLVVENARKRRQRLEPMDARAIHEKPSAKDFYEAARDSIHKSSAQQLP